MTLEFIERYRVPIVFFGGLFLFWGALFLFYGRGKD